LITQWFGQLENSTFGVIGLEFDRSFEVRYVGKNRIGRSAMPEFYEIMIKGHLDSRWSEWLTGMMLKQLEGDGTLISGELPDQAALHGLLERIRDLNLTLISVKCQNQSISNADEFAEDRRGESNE
jgi:hypothetical protein